MSIKSYATSTVVAIMISALNTPVSSCQTSTKADFLRTPTDEDALAEQELARIMPTGARLLKLAASNPPLPQWFDEEEEAPF